MALHEFLIETFYFLIATLALVPLFKKLNLGSMLGYIVAGVIVGPMSLGLIDSTDNIVQLAEVGITLLLFIVGLELSPARLKQLRSSIIFEGGLQMGLSTLVFTAIGIAVGLSSYSALVIGVSLSLSSTAFALSYMNETSQLTLSHGQSSLSILLFQDLIIVPLLALIPLLSINSSSHQIINMTEMAIKFGLFCGLIMLCFYVLKPAVSFIKKSQDQEISLAAFLFLIIGMALGMEKLGLSMPMGAFIAGAFLANSEVKIQIKTLTVPFKGVLMGLFFMTLGMNLELNFLMNNLAKIALLSFSIIALKTIILSIIGKFSHGSFKSGLKVGFIISQGGEFGVVVLASAMKFNVVSAEINKLIVTSILITMTLAPFLARMTKFINNANASKLAQTEEHLEESNVIQLKKDDLAPEADEVAKKAA